jgi:hypothetical protein
MTLHKKCDMKDCHNRAVKKIKLDSADPEFGEIKRYSKFRVCRSCYLVFTNGNEQYSALDTLVDRGNKAGENPDYDVDLDTHIINDILGHDKSGKKINE